MNNKDYMFFRILFALSISCITGIFFCILIILSLFSYILTNNPIYLFELLCWAGYTGVMVWQMGKLKKDIEKYGGKIK